MVDNKVRTILGLAPVMDGETDTGTLTDNSEGAEVEAGRSRRSASEPVAIVASSSSASFHPGRKERHRTESSNTSSSLNYSSSVEVISEMEDETRFEQAMTSSFF